MSASSRHRWSSVVLPSGRVLWSCSRCTTQAEAPLWVNGPSSAAREAVCFRRAKADAPWERYQGSIGLRCTQPAATNLLGGC